MSKDGDLRMLGVVDGFAHVLVALKTDIRRIMHYPIDPRHVRKQRERAGILDPLLELQKRIQQHHAETLAAYKRTTE